MTVTYTTDGGLVGVSFLSAAEGGSGGLDGGFGGGGGLPSFGRTLLAELTSSLLLDEGTGNPTWSRATKAWGFNELGYLEELASGCAFFGGARLVRNTVRTTSEDFSNAAWIKFGSITAPSANILVCANATSAQYINQGGVQSIVPGQKLLYGVRAQKVVGGVDFIQIAGQSTAYGAGQFCNISLIDGTYSATGCSPVVTPLGGGAYDITVVFTCVAAGFDVYNIVFANALSSTRVEAFVGDGVKSFELLRAWSVDVTNYDASYVPEYVSVGVVATPFFGAGIDGAKYFETDWQGAPIPAANLLGFRIESAATNNVLYCRNLTNNRWIQTLTTGSEITTNGIFDSDTNWTKGSGWSISAGVATRTGVGAISNLAQVVPISEGTAYLVGYDVAISSGNITATFGGGATANGISRAATGTYSEVIIPNSGNYELRMSASSSFVGTLDNVSIKVAAVQPAMTATGIDGIANTATTLTAFAADAIILQPITLASAVRCASAYVKRRTGTGTISFTQDGGSTWTDITSQINSSTWSRVQITSTLANPSVGFKISTSGDAIDVDCVQNEAGAIATSPIVTTTAAVTRNVESLTYQTASNWSDTEGTAYIEAQPLAWVAGGAIGSATNGLLLSAANSGATASDGTNTANGPAGSPSGREKLAMRWGGGAMTVASGGVVGTAGTYDGGMGLASVGIAVNSSVYCGRVAIYDYAMTDAELQAITA